MSTYDKRRTFKLYSDGRTNILTSQQAENENLLIRVTASDCKLYLNKITDAESESIQSKSSRPFVNLVDSYGCIGLFKPPISRGSWSFWILRTQVQILRKKVSLIDAREGHDYYLIFIKDAQSINSIGKTDILRISDVYIVYLNQTDDYMQYSTNLNNNSSYFVEIRYLENISF